MPRIRNNSSLLTVGLCCLFFRLFQGTGVAQQVTCRLPSAHQAYVDQPVVIEPGCEGDAGHGYQYQWNPGDEAGDRPWSDSSRLSVTYAKADGYTAILKVKVDGAWLPANTFSVAIQVLTPVTGNPPASSSTLAYDRIDGRLWNVNSDNGSITQTDAKTGARIRETPMKGEPKNLALDSNGNVWVTVRNPSSLVKVDRMTGKAQSIPLPYGSLPFGLVIDRAGHKAYVSLEATGKVAKIDLESFAIGAMADVFPTPRAMALSHDGKRLLVARLHTSVRQELPPDSSYGELAELSTADLTVTHRIPLAYDRTPDSRLGGSGVLTQLRSLVIHPDGKKAWVTAVKANIFRGRVRSGKDFDPNGENALRSVVAVIDLDHRKEDLSRRLDVDDSGMPSAIAFTANGAYGFLATQGTNSIEILGGETLQDVGTVGPVHYGPEMAPDGLVLSPDDSLLFAHNFTTRTLGIYDRTRIGPTGGLLSLKTVSLVSQDRLAPRQLKGLQLFYNSADPRITKSGYISCAICHLDGGSDRLVWDFTERGEGLRKTIPMLGRAGTGHGPVHWSANFDEIQDFEHDIRGPFAGTGLMDEAIFSQGSRNRTLGDGKAGFSRDLDDLAAYVSTLATFDASPYRNQDGSMTGEALAGREIFRRPEVGCAACHSGRNFTDSDLGSRPFRLHDVGTLRPTSGKRLGDTLIGLDTPTLLGIWQFPPYLHDGSARTLMDVITTGNPENRHGRTSDLDERERRQLVEYLMQLDGSEAGAMAAHEQGKRRTGFGLRATPRNNLLEMRFDLPQGPSRVVVRITDARGRTLAKVAAHRRSGGYLAQWRMKADEAVSMAGKALFFQVMDSDRIVFAGKAVLMR